MELQVVRLFPNIWMVPPFRRLYYLYFMLWFCPVWV